MTNQEYQLQAYWDNVGIQGLTHHAYLDVTFRIASLYSLTECSIYSSRCKSQAFR